MKLASDGTTPSNAIVPPMDVVRSFLRDPFIAFPIAGNVITPIVVLLWLPRSTLELSPENVTLLAEGLGMLLLCFLAGYVVARRMQARDSPLASLLRKCAGGLMLLATAALLVAPFGFFFGALLYLATITTAPLMDAQLARIDAFIGFDWLAFLALTNSSPIVSKMLVVAYHSTVPLVAFVLFYLSLTHRPHRLAEFIALLSVTSLTTAFVMWCVPAAGAYVWFEPAPHLFTNFTEHAGLWHYDALMALRSGETFVYVSSENPGIVTFPSYHTVLGIITAYALRKIRFIGPFVVVLNSIMIVGTLPEGGHHLIDIFAGVVIAFGAIGLMRAYIRKTSKRSNQESRQRVASR